MVGKAVDEAVDIFTFSIGAGAAGTCQLLNGYDLLGAFDSFKPKFAKRYANLADIATKAFADYAADVRAQAFPDDEHKMKNGEGERLAAMLKRANTTNDKGQAVNKGAQLIPNGMLDDNYPRNMVCSTCG